ncbi:MAG: ornithine cyclodeaminase family protein, partial [Chloroflexi bacterium]|nr:ornithine cyclodeaminase family protein [Chloroflexota bacterium]
GEELHLNIQVADSAEEAAAGADVVICATTSSISVLRSAWLKEGVHVNTLGPKFHDAHEIEIEIAERAAVIATDSLAQVDAYPKPFFLADTPYYDRMVELADLLAGKRPGRSADDQITLFLSVGLAGTEVVLANELLRRVKGG